MFSRRHPLLFFILVFFAIVSVTTVATTMILVLGTRSSDFEFGEKVGVIEISGMISDSRDVLEDLKRFRKDDEIKAIVMRIDSPGGVVGPSQEIYREIRRTTESKPVITSMGSIAASGGYYIAAATQGIVANPGTITGSIGVIIGYTNFRALLDKIGLSPVVIKSGEFKDLASPVRPMTESERRLLQEFVDQTHRQFMRAVAEGRKMELPEVEAIADGRIYTGEQAMDLGLVDRLGNLEDAVAWAGNLGGISGEIDTVYSREDKMSLLNYLMETSADALARHLVGSNVFAGYLYRPTME